MDEQFLDKARIYAERAYNIATESLNNATFLDADIRKALAANAMAKYFIRISKVNEAEKYLMEAYGILENRGDYFLDKASTMVRLFAK